MGDTSDDARGEKLQQEQQSPQQQEEKSAGAKPTLSAATVFDTSFDRLGLVMQLIEKGAAVVDNLLSDPGDLQCVLQEAQRAGGVPAVATAAGASRTGGGDGSAGESVVAPTTQPASIRNDLTHDVDPFDETRLPQLAKAARTMQFAVGGALDAFMPQELFARERPQFAVYPGDGSFYRRHFDNPKNLAQGHDNKRRATILLYLNENWVGANGGQLRLLLRSPVSGLEEVKVNPIANRCVVFFSDLVEHEVLAAHAHRVAITVWLSECSSTTACDKDKLSRDFFSLACHHAAAQHAREPEPEPEPEPELESDSKRAADVARGARLAKQVEVAAAAAVPPAAACAASMQATSSMLSPPGEDLPRCERSGMSAGCTGMGNNLIDVAYEGRVVDSPPTRRLVRVCDVCAEQLQQLDET
jgi:hypothetical protein